MPRSPCPDICAWPFDPDRRGPDSLLLLLISFEVLIVRFDLAALILGATAIEAEGQRLPQRQNDRLNKISVREGDGIYWCAASAAKLRR